ncbi:MBL fold metallo-hydrolase, partial [Streptomyces sp. S6]
WPHCATATTQSAGTRSRTPPFPLRNKSAELDRPGGGTVTVTGVPAIHGPGRREDVEPFSGQVVGFVLTGEGLPTVYVSGDNASLDAVRETAERFAPVDTAVLFAGAPRLPGRYDGAPLVLDSAQAAEAARLLEARRVVPVHYDSWAHFTEGRGELVAAFTQAGLLERLDLG